MLARLLHLFSNQSILTASGAPVASGLAKVPRNGWETTVDEFAFLVIGQGPASSRRPAAGIDTDFTSDAREALAERGEKLGTLATATERLADDARDFEARARALRKQAESQNSWFPF